MSRVGDREGVSPSLTANLGTATTSRLECVLRWIERRSSEQGHTPSLERLLEHARRGPQMQELLLARPSLELKTVTWLQGVRELACVLRASVRQQCLSNCIKIPQVQQALQLLETQHPEAFESLGWIQRTKEGSIVLVPEHALDTHSEVATDAGLLLRASLDLSTMLVEERHQSLDCQKWAMVLEWFVVLFMVQAALCYSIEEDLVGRIETVRDSSNSLTPHQSKVDLDGLSAYLLLSQAGIIDAIPGLFNESISLEVAPGLVCTLQGPLDTSQYPRQVPQPSILASFNEALNGMWIAMKACSAQSLAGLLQALDHYVAISPAPQPFSLLAAHVPSYERLQLVLRPHFQPKFHKWLVLARVICEEKDSSQLPTHLSLDPRHELFLSFFLANVPALVEAAQSLFSEYSSYQLYLDRRAARCLAALTCLPSIPPAAIDARYVESLREAIFNTPDEWNTLQEFTAIHLLTASLENPRATPSYLDLWNFSSHWDLFEEHSVSGSKLRLYLPDHIHACIGFIYNTRQVQSLFNTQTPLKCSTDPFQLFYDELDRHGLAPVDLFDFEERSSSMYQDLLLAPTNKPRDSKWLRTPSEIALGFVANICHRLSGICRRHAGRAKKPLRYFRMLAQILLSEQHLHTLGRLNRTMLVSDIVRALGPLRDPQSTSVSPCRCCVIIADENPSAHLGVADFATLYLLQPLQSLTDDDYGWMTMQTYLVWSASEEEQFAKTAFGLWSESQLISRDLSTGPAVPNAFSSYSHFEANMDSLVHPFEDIQMRRNRRLFYLLRVLFPFVLSNCSPNLADTIDTSEHSDETVKRASRASLKAWLSASSRASIVTTHCERASWHAIIPGSVTRLLFHALCRVLAAPPTRLSLLILRIFYETLPGSSLFMYRLPLLKDEDLHDILSSASSQKENTVLYHQDGILHNTSESDHDGVSSSDRTAQTAVTNGLHLDMWSRALLSVFSQSLPTQGAVIPSVDLAVAAAQRAYAKDTGKQDPTGMQGSNELLSINMATFDMTETLAQNSNVTEYLRLNNLVSNLFMLSRATVPSAVVPLEDTPVHDLHNMVCPFHISYESPDYTGALRNDPDDKNVGNAVGILFPSAATATYHRRRNVGTVASHAYHPPAAALLSLLTASLPRVASCLSRVELNGEANCPISALRIFPGPAHIDFIHGCSNSFGAHSKQPCTCEGGSLVAAPFQVTHALIRTPLTLYLDLTVLLQTLFCTSPISALTPPTSHPTIATLTSQLTYLSSFASASAPKRLLAALSTLTSSLLALTSNSYSLTAVCLAHCATSLVVSTSPLISRIQSPTLTLSSSLLARFLPGAPMSPLSLPLFDSIFTHLFRVLHEVNPDLFPVPHPSLAVRATFSVRASTMLLPFFLVRPSLISFLQALCTTAAASTPPQRMGGDDQQEDSDQMSDSFAKAEGNSPSAFKRRTHVMVTSALSFVSARICLLIRPLFRSLARYYRDAIPALRSPQAPHPLLQKLLLGKLQIQKHNQQQAAAAMGVELPMQLVAYYKARLSSAQAGKPITESANADSPTRQPGPQQQSPAPISGDGSSTKSTVSLTGPPSEFYQIDDRGGHSAFSLAPLSLVIPLVTMLDTLRILPLSLRPLPFFLADAFPQSGQVSHSTSQLHARPDRLSEPVSLVGVATSYPARKESSDYDHPGKIESSLAVLYLISQLLFELIPQPLTPPSVALLRAALLQFEGRHPAHALPHDVASPPFGPRSPPFGPGAGPAPLEDPTRLLNATAAVPSHSPQSIHHQSQPQSHVASQASTMEAVTTQSVPHSDTYADTQIQNETVGIDATLDTVPEPQADEAVVAQLINAEAESFLAASAAAVAPISSSSNLATTLATTTSPISPPEASTDGSGNVLGVDQVRADLGAIDLIHVDQDGTPLELEAMATSQTHTPEKGTEIGPLLHDFDEDVDRMLRTDMEDDLDERLIATDASTVRDDAPNSLGSTVEATHFALGVRRRSHEALPILPGTRSNVPPSDLSDAQIREASAGEATGRAIKGYSLKRLRLQDDVHGGNSSGSERDTFDDASLASTDGEDSAEDTSNVSMTLIPSPITQSQSAQSDSNSPDSPKLSDLTVLFPGTPTQQPSSGPSSGASAGTLAARTPCDILRRAVVLAPAAIEFVMAEYGLRRHAQQDDRSRLYGPTGIQTEAATLSPEMILGATLQALAWSKADSAGALWPLFKRTFQAIQQLSPRECGQE